MMQAYGDVEMDEAQPNAATRVFGITELAEQIIYDLPLRQLLMIQRICPSLRDVVQGSSALKKRLYLKPSHSTTMTLLPLELKPPHIVHSRIITYDLPCGIVSIIVVNVNRHFQNRDEEGSWRKMQISSAPMAYGRVAVYDSHGYVWMKNLSSAQGGLTMGDLADAVHFLRQGEWKFKLIQCVLYADRDEFEALNLKYFVV